MEAEDMNSKTDFDINSLPWGKILAKFYEQYDEILERHLKNYSHYYKRIFELLRHTQIEIKFDPGKERKGKPATDDEGIIFWNDLAIEVNEKLRNILVEEYNVAEEVADAVQVGNLAITFLSPFAGRDEVCWEAHTCANGLIRYVPCPCGG
jgi:hypothetical protein